MIKIRDMEIGDKVQIETGYTNWDRADNEFYCEVVGRDKKGRIILDAKNSVCFDGRNKIQPFFLVDPNTSVLNTTFYNKIPGCFVLRHVIGMDTKGRFILKTQLRK